MSRIKAVEVEHEDKGQLNEDDFSHIRPPEITTNEIVKVIHVDEKNIEDVPGQDFYFYVKRPTRHSLQPNEPITAERITFIHRVISNGRVREHFQIHPELDKIIDAEANTRFMAEQAKFYKLLREMRKDNASQKVQIEEYERMWVVRFVKWIDKVFDFMSIPLIPPWRW